MSSVVIKISTTKTPTLPAVRLYRQPHDVEIIHYDEPENWAYGGDGYRRGAVRNVAEDSPKPEVYRFKDSDFQTPISCAWITLWRNMNPMLTDISFSSLLASGLAWMNNTGAPPHSNCVINYVGDGKDPSFHTPIRNGGQVFTGVEQNGFLLVESLLTSSPVPSAAWVIARPWLWGWGVSVKPNGDINYIVRKGRDGTMHNVRVPLITKLPVKIRLEELHKLPLGTPVPDPTWMA